MTTRDISQNNALQAVKKAHFIAGIEAATGWGKTRVALNIIKEYKPKTLLIVVPTIVLKLEWEKQLKEQSILGDVWVINTASKTIAKYEMLVIDEAHTSVAETFFNLFTNIKYNKLIWLTATIERTDNKHLLLLNKAPIVFKITLQECITNGWTSDIIINKLPVKINTVEQKKLTLLNNKYEELSGLLGGNPFLSAVKYLKLLNFRQANHNGKYYSLIELKKFAKSKKIHNFKTWLYSNFTVIEKSIYAKEWYQTVNKRKLLLYTIKDKEKITLKLLKNEKKKTIVFSMNIDFINNLYEKLSGKEEVFKYHSKMTKKARLKSLTEFKASKKGIMLSVMALIEGLDIPDLERGIITSYTSSKIKSIQSKGKHICPHSSNSGKSKS